MPILSDKRYYVRAQYGTAYKMAVMNRYQIDRTVPSFIESSFRHRLNTQRGTWNCPRINIL